MYKRILIAYDGSEHAKKAAKIAGELANNMRADVWVVIAYDPLPGYLGIPNMQDAIDARLKKAQEDMYEAVEDIGPLTGKLTQEIMEGPATEAILTVAEVRKIDLIIMGSRGLGRLEGALIGSHSQKVVSHAKCPVLLVR